MPSHDDATLVGDFRRAVAQGLVPNNGDPVKMANATIDSVYANPPPSGWLWEAMLTLPFAAYLPAASLRSTLKKQ